MIQTVDEFGYCQFSFYRCSKKEIDRILFHKYIMMKRKAVPFADPDSLDRFVEEKPRTARSLGKRAKAYSAILPVGYRLVHTITVKKLSLDAEYMLTKTPLSPLLPYSKTEIFKSKNKAKKKIRSEIKKDVSQHIGLDNIEHKKWSHGNKIACNIDFWQRCSYEYDESDIVSMQYCLKKIHFLKGKDFLSKDCIDKRMRKILR